MSSSPATFAAAAITWSNSSRRTEPSDDLADDALALGLTQRTGERRVLPQVVRPPGIVRKHSSDLRDGAVQHLLPLLGIAVVDSSLVAPLPDRPQRLIDDRPA